METPSRFTFAPDGSTTVFQIPVQMKGDNYVRIDIDNTTVNDRNKFDIVNNSIVFVSNTDVPAGSQLDILVVQTDEGIANLGNVTSIDLVSQNIVAINTVATDIAAVVNNSNNIAAIQTVNSNMSSVLTAVQASVDAAASEAAALASENAAKVSENAAKASENASKASENAASASETAAAGSASAANTSLSNAVAAELAAIQASADADTSKNAASVSATNAANSAATASTKASEASASAAAAAGSEAGVDADRVAAQAAASAAATSETNAATSETNAATSETNAANSAASSASSATDSANSATAASTSETNAAASETNAAASEAAASTSETNAAASEASAATDAATATTKASEASTSATNAAASANSAQVSKDAALAALDNFDDRYLGQKASDPATDNDGDPLVAGTLYFNTTDETMKVFEGSLWVAAYASLSGAMIGANNLSDVASVGDSRNNLGLGASDTPTFAGLTTTGDVSFGDNDKALFGAGSDLQIYHDGSNSYIDDAGTGDLYLRSSNDLLLTNADGSENYARFQESGYARLFYNNSLKFATTSTGVDVTGTITSDGLTVDGGTTTEIKVFSQGRVNPTTLSEGASGAELMVGSSNPLTLGTASLDRLTVASNGDISFYEDTGTTPKFFWDASAERLGIGTSSSRADLSVYRGTATDDFNLLVTTFRPNIVLEDMSTNASDWQLFADGGDLQFRYGDASTDTKLANEAMRIDSSGNVGIGTTGPTEKLHVSGNILATGDVTAFSDERLKTEVETISEAVDKVKQLRGVTFQKDGRDSLGVIAQEVQKVLPEVVHESGDYLSVAYGNIVGLLIEAVKEQQVQIDELKARVGE